MDSIDREGVVKFIVSLQKADGSFTGDKWGEKKKQDCPTILSPLSVAQVKWTRVSLFVL